jgi:threonine synthase
MSTLRCAACAATYTDDAVRYRCTCGGTLDAVVDLAAVPVTRDDMDRRLASKHPADRSGVWRFRELILPGVDPEELVTRGEGDTGLYHSMRLARYVGLDALAIKHEGENPTGSFKDRGMTVGMTVAKRLGMQKVACASTGNTSASMAAYAASAGLEPWVFVPAGNISFGKLAQALAYGARTVQIDGDFDDAMRLVQELCREEGIYLLNSINPFRIEGQKAIGYEILSDLDWEVPDWVVLPGGNLGNSSALAKGFAELLELGWIDRLPKIAVVQASGANPLYTAFHTGKTPIPIRAQTRATAIRIGDPVSWRKCLRGLAQCGGTVEQATDQEILDAKAHVDASGIGAEPASAATIAGLKKLVAAGTIQPHERVVGVLTGHLLKDPGVVIGYHQGTLEGIESRHANAPVPSPATLDALLSIVRSGA